MTSVRQANAGAECPRQRLYAGQTGYRRPLVKEEMQLSVGSLVAEEVADDAVRQA